MIVAFFPNKVRIAIYRFFGAKIGKCVRIGLGTVILADYIEIGDHTNIGSFCRIKVSKITLGKYVQISNLAKITAHTLKMDSRAIIGENTHISGDNRDKRSILMMGMHSWIFQNCFINVTREVTMGKNVGVGGGTYLFTHGYWLNKLEGFPVAYGSVIIEDDVWIPWSCFIMPGTTIGSNAIIGARSLVTKDVPRNAFVAGSPAKVIRDQSFRKIDKKEKIEIITKSIKEFAEQRSYVLEILDTDLSLEYNLNNSVFLIIYHKYMKTNDILKRSALNVFFDEISKEQAEQFPCFSLKDYCCSSFDIIPEKSKDWLIFARNFGLRFYAIDEIS
jgi:acetyltransferase-like isoleucine patch superfamily enzyme